MACPSSGQISLQDIVNEFGGTLAGGIFQFYAGAGLVPAGTKNAAGVTIPSSGKITLFDFYGAAAAASGTFTWETPGTFDGFLVPPFHNSVIWTVVGAGGGGGQSGADGGKFVYAGGGGSAGGQSSVSALVTAAGGGGGQGAPGGHIAAGGPGAPGSGTVGQTVTTGTGSLGGAGGKVLGYLTDTAGGDGGRGGTAVSTWTASNCPIAVGQPVSVLVGAGGQGGSGSLGEVGQNGSPGKVTVTWS